MEKDFTPYEQALALKELGFDGGCFSLYFNNGEFSNFIHDYKVNDEVVEKTNSVLAPTFSQAFRWFREEYDLYSHVRESYSFDNTLEFVSQINGSYVNRGISSSASVNSFETYEEAELECLKKLIEIVKTK